MWGQVQAPQAQWQLPILLVIGFALFAGTVGARFFRRLRVPQVVGYIAIGALLGKSGLGAIDDAAIDNLLPFNFFALGVIGFLIGGELRGEVFRRHGWQFLTILLSQGIGAFLVVSILVSLTGLLVTRDLATSAALGLVIGAIASATAPAATVNVLWEYKTRGPLTTAVYAMVALDDGLALILYAFAFSIASGIIGAPTGGVFAFVGPVARKLIGAAAMGVAAGYLLNFVLRRVRDPELSLTITIGTLALVLGGALALELDLILAAMTLGAALVNLAPRRSQQAFHIVQRFAAPIYVLFFVVAGARLHLGGMQLWMWVLAGPYLVGRIAAKVAGAHLGARWAGAGPSVRKYLGWCLFCQGGVAVGLSILASVGFSKEMPGPVGKQLGDAIIMMVAVTTFIVELAGPPFVRLAVKRAGEVGLDVTEEDLMNSYRVADMVNRKAPVFAENTTLATILGTIAETDAMCYPVTNAAGKLTGIIRIPELKQSFGSAGLQDWLVAMDVMQPVPDTITADAPLVEAVTRMREQHLDYLPVVKADDNSALEGMLELRAVDRALSGEVLRRHRLAEAAEA
ncbi:MAG: hypothetical protein AMJ81_10085 [Phycisphaerae bacterium SM23_33]|nr:MAG: hypothetical protein AMJ81_10085 [Phycisphaerae bacterium SM23_33]